MIAQIAPAQINAPVVFLGDAAKYELDRIKVKGKAVAVQVMFGCLHGDTSDK